MEEEQLKENSPDTYYKKKPTKQKQTKNIKQTKFMEKS